MERSQAVNTSSFCAGRQTRVDVAILGARMHYAVPSVLAKAGLLGTFFTDTYLGNKPSLRRLLKRLPARALPSYLRRLRGREAQDLEPGKVVSFDTLGLKSAWLRRRVRSQAELFKLHAATAREFCERVVSCGISGASAVYTLNAASLEIFQEAKRRGILCIQEQTIAPARIESGLLSDEAERWPGWQPKMICDLNPNPVAVREEQEWALADRIMCGSEFVAAGIGALGAETTKCQVVPYGIDTHHFRPKETRLSKDTLNVLFVGAVGLRKGVLYLLEALRRLRSARVHCRLVGLVEVDWRRLADYSGSAEVLGPLPRSEIMRMYRWADVLVLPSICEGSALVTYEALACGLPIVTTANSGSVVRDGVDGFVVPIRDSEAIAARLERLLEDTQLLAEMSANARSRAQEFDLDNYGAQVVAAIEALCPQAHPERLAD